MKKFFKILLRLCVKTPLKISLTISSVALGTGILILSFSAGEILEDQVISKMNENGIVVYAANGEWSTDGTFDSERPSQWDANIFDTLLSDSIYVKAAAMVLDNPISDVSVNGTSYILRSSVGTDPSYFDVFSLEIINGVPMAYRDFSSGFKKVWISEDFAIQVFGSAEDAVGQTVIPLGTSFIIGLEGQGRNHDLLTQYSVAGVYTSPSEVARRSYGISDLIFPATALIPSGDNASRMLDFISGQMVISSSTNSVDKISTEIAQIVENNYGSGISLDVWEGNIDGESSYIEELRQTVSIFTISVNILGVVLLLTSSLGIFSIMVVEALGRRREIALERSLGASQFHIVKEFWTWSLMLSFFGAFIGIALAFLFAKPLLGIMAPLLGELTETFSQNSGVKITSLISGVLLAVGCGGLFGLLPAFSAVKGNISQTLREV
jgi:ABC-type antimicrobial peptide transport system permease subunit